MTRTELRAVLERVEAHWPMRPVTDTTSLVWWEELADMPGEAVMLAVRSIARGGREFPPSPGTVLAEIAKATTDLPDFDQAWSEILHTVRVAGTRDVPRFLERLSHPVVRALAESVGVRELGMADESTLPTWHAQARDRYAMIAARARRQVTHASLPPARVDPAAIGAAVRVLAERVTGAPS